MMKSLLFKKLVLVIPFGFIIVLGGVFIPETAQSKLDTNVPADISEKELRAVVVEDFETQSDWTLESVPKKNPDQAKNPVPVLELKYVDGGPSSLSPEPWAANKKGLEKKKMLGIHFKFKYPGHNSVHILPPPEVRWDDPTKQVLTYDPRLGKEVQERAIQLPGRAKGVSLWFHGRGNDYNLEVWVKDYRGDVHILKFGSVNFVGWRPLKVDIPANVPQEISSYPQTKITKIVRFVIRSSPYAGNEDVYMFLDQIKVLTDVYEVNFDGQDLHKVFEGGSSKKETGKKNP